MMRGKQSTDSVNQVQFMEYIAYIHRVHRVQMYFDVKDTILRLSEPGTVYGVHSVHT